MPGPTVLSQQKQEEFLDGLVRVVMDNFSLARRMAEVLIDATARGVPPPRATVLLSGDGISVEIPGTNCGFVTTPIIHNAILDTRRSLEFFGLTFDPKTRRLTQISKRRFSDDLGVEHFGLMPVTSAQLIRVCSLAIQSSFQDALWEVWNWSNKELAHFTLAAPIVNLPSIRDVSAAMVQGYMCFVFDALGHPRPQLNPS